jgi:hypothetical protein
LSSLIQQALRDRNPITRRLAFARLLESLTPGNAGAVREQLVALGAEPDQWRDFHYSWGAIDGKAAFAHAATTPEADLAATLTGWTAANPREALALIDNLPAAMLGQRDELVASVVSGLTHHDPAMATDYVVRLGREGNAKAGELMETVANATVRLVGPEAASRWAESLADGPLKGNAMAKVAEVYVRRDPEAAARWTTGFADKEYASRTIEQVGARWAASNPVAAVGWLESLPALVAPNGNPAARVPLPARQELAPLAEQRGLPPLLLYALEDELRRLVCSAQSLALAGRPGPAGP